MRAMKWPRTTDYSKELAKANFQKAIVVFIVEISRNMTMYIEGKIMKTKYVIGCAYWAPNSPVNELFDYLDDVIRAEHRAGK